MAFDPTKPFTVVQQAPAFDPSQPFKKVEDEPHTQGYLADKARRLGRGAPEAIGRTVASIGSGLESAAQLAEDALLATAVKRGDMTEEDAAKVRQHFAEKKAQDPLFQGAQAVRDVGAQLTAVGPKWVNEPDRTRDDEIGSAVISGATSMLPLLAAARINPALAIPSYAGQMGESQRAEAAAAGANPSDQAQAYGLAAGLGAGSEALLGVPALFRSIQGAKIVPELLAQGEKLIDSAVSKALSKQILARSAGQVVKGGIREGLQEGVEQIGGNVIAKDLVGYDPERDRTQGVGMAMLAGGIVGGGVGGIEQYRNDRAQLKGHEAYKAELDTDKNVPEATKTLLLQRDQLQRGLRPAQMFPKGTPELPVPQGMERVETERGIFHFNPQQTSADDIVALSKAGRENEILNLGPFSKPEIEAQAKKTGEPILTVNERAPDGTEVKSSVATPSTAGAQAQVVDATKTPGNTVDVTTPGQTILERLRAQQEAQDQARREADAKEEAARTTRRAELDAKKARFDQEMNAARTLAADPAADYTKVKAGVTTLTQYVQDNSLGLTQDQRNEALAELARLTPRLESLEPAYQAQRDASEAKARQQADLARQARIEKIRAENARIDAIEATGRDPDTGRIVEIEKVPDEELDRLDLQAEGIDEDTYAEELQRREREAATENTAGYNLRDLFIGRKDKLGAAGLKTPLRLPTPETERARGGQGGELAVLQEGGVPWQYFAKEAKGLDALAETLRGLGFQAETENDAIALVQRAFAGEDVRPTGGEMQFAQAKTQAARRSQQGEPTTGSAPSREEIGNLRLYHGSPTEWDKPSLGRPGTLWLTDDPKEAAKYARGGRVREYDVRLGKVADLTTDLALKRKLGKIYNRDPEILDDPDRSYDFDQDADTMLLNSADVLEYLESQGYNSAKGFEEPGIYSYAIFDTAQLQPPKPQFAQGKAQDPRQMSLGDLSPIDRATADWSAAFDEAMEDYYQRARDSVDTDPPQRVSAEDQARRDREILTPAAARQRIEQWKAAAKKQGKTGKNSDKIILSLFDSTGVWSQPWRDAGYTVVQIDQNIVGGDGIEMDVMDIDQEWLMDNGLDMVHGVLAACPCTEFAGSGARWFKIKDANGRTEKARQLVHHTLAIIEYLQPDGFWAIENPVGRIKQETGIPTEQLQFQPHNYGDPYTKRTQIFGMFNPNLPQANVAPTGGSYSWNLSGTSAKAKAERSKTFEGFAYAFFMANQDRDARAEAEATADQKTGPQFGQRKATAANRVSAKQPGQLTDAEVAKQLQALRAALGPIAEEFDIQVGLIADLLEKEGYAAAARKVRSGDYGVLNAVTAPRLKAQLDEIRHQPRFIVVASLSAQAGKLTGLTLHELAHPFYDALPDETKDVLRQMHAQETSSRTGPLFKNGKIQTDVAILASDLPAERIDADADLPVKEWFAERLRKLNEQWLDGKIALADSPTIVRLWRQFMDALRRIFAQIRRIEQDSDLFTDTFRQWIATSTKMDLAAPATAYATNKRADFAQGLLQLDSPIGLGLPIEIRNLTPNWQNKSLRFESNLDKALYYAGVTGYTGTRDKLIRHLSEQTGMSTGQIAALARELRLKLRALTRSAATGSTITIPPQMREAAAELTGVEFAQQANLLPEDQAGHTNVTRDFKREELPAGDNPPTKGDLDDLKLYAFPGNKSEINSKIYGLIQRAVQAADHVADLTLGAGVHYQTARRADRAGQVKEWTVNEWSPLRVAVVRQMGQAPETVLDQAAKFYAEILAARKAARAALGKKAKANQAQRAESRAVQAWMNRTVWEHVLSAGFDIDAWVDANGAEANLPIQDTPTAAAWALVAQEYKGGLDSVELTVRPVDATQEMDLGDSKRENYRPRGGQRFRLGDILTQISYPTASRSNADGSGIDRAARDRLLKIATGYQGATVTQGDAWDKLVPLAQAAKDKGQRLLVFLDPPYWKNTDLKGGSSNYSAAVSAGASLSGLRKRVDILKKAHDLGARVLFTNDWHPLLANDLRKAGYYVISENRANDATKPEVIAFNWNPQNGNQETRPEAHTIHLSDGGTSNQLEQGLQDSADAAGDPDDRAGRSAAESDTARLGEEDRTDSRTQQPAQRVAEIDARLAELTTGVGQDEAAIEEEGKRLADERAQLVRDMHEAEQRAIADAQLKTAAELEQTASDAAKLTKHPAAQGNVLPGEAWATVPAMTPNQIQKEIEAIGEYFSDNIDSLSGAEKGNLNARVDALKAELKRREDPIAAAPRVQAIVPTTREQRRDALQAELQRGRKMRDDGIKASNDEAEREGLRIVRRATEALNDEFPGWEQQAVPNQTKGQIENAPASQPAPATRAQRAEDDGRNLPPAPPIEPPENGQPMEDPPPPDRGRVGDLFGHSAHVPTWLERSWSKIRHAMVGIRGSVPELPTFPAASWNKKDRFIAREGAEFYNRLQEFWRVLRSGNDYIQRTAEEAVSDVVAPLLRLGGDFDAAGYKKLQRLQEKARVLRSTNKPVPARMAATIQALTSRMESHPYVLFNRFVVLMDLDWRMKNLKDSKGNPIRLPLGLNSTELEKEIQRINRLIAGHRHAQDITTAIERHLALVKQVSDDLVRRDLFAAEHLRNPYYFPHLTLEITQGDEVKQRVLQPERVRPGTEADFRGYLIDPVGSTKPIETDYVRAMYYHMVQVGAHNFKADAIRDHARSYDVMKQVQDRAQELSKQRGQAVSWEQVFNEEYAPQGYVLYGTDSRDAFPTLQIDRDKLAFRLGEELTSEDLQDQLRALGARGIRLQPEDIRQTLIQGQRETWVVPARVAEALRGIARRQEALEHDRGNPWTAAMGMWKAWKLFTPHNHIRYEFNNVVADLEKIWSATPGTFLQLPKAAKEIRDFYLGGKPGDDLRAAMKDGVINAITAQEMGQLQKMRAFEKFQTMSERLRRQALARGSSLVLQPITVLTGLGDLTSVELSAFRESTVRYANYLANLEAIRNGARPAYAGAYWRDIEAIQDSAPGAGDRAQRQAAQISKATFGDYGDLTVNGEWLRKNLVPFYSWMEVNFKYHANLLRNLRDMARAGETTNAQAAGQAAKTLAGFGTRTAAGVALRLALPYAAVALWNTIGGPMAGAWDDDDDLESELSEEDRRRFHIILGRTPDGKVNVIYGATALADVMKWFSGPAFVQHMSNWLKGRTDFLTAATGWRDEILPNLVNTAAGSLGPAVKIGVALTLRKNTFPDITDARTIPAYDLWRNVVAQTTDDFTADQLWRLIGKDYVQAKDLGTWTKQLILQIRQRDPEAWAFYAIKDKAAEFEYQQTGRRDGFAERDAPDQQVLRNFRRAVYQADLETASKMYLRLLDMGYTAERFQGSIRAQDPLSTLSKTDGLRQRFVESLDATDQQLLRRAFAYYGRMAASRGAEQYLFPPKEWGAAGQSAYQAQPRTELLRQIIAIQGQGISQQRINAEMWRSLQVR